MRAQMEMLGLLVIVVLFIFGGLIYLFFLQKPVDTSLPDLRQSAEVSNLLNTMMKVTPCEDLSDTLEDVIVTCYMFSGNRDYCGNPDCKAYIKEVVANVTRSYNSGWQYSFEIKEGSSLFLSDGSCSLPKRMAAHANVRFGKTSLLINLLVCLK